MTGARDTTAPGPREMRPRRGWTEERDVVRVGGATLAASAWRRGDLSVVSSLVVAEMPDGRGEGPQWHVSVSSGGARPNRAEVREALAAFGMAGAEEDNHLPGRARHFWRPVDPARRVVCECKSSEVTVVEPGGFRWTNPADGPCRGCAAERITGLPCPLHRPRG